MRLSARLPCGVAYVLERLKQPGFLSIIDGETGEVLIEFDKDAVVVRGKEVSLPRLTMIEG